jgi:hypothetical protein
MDEEKVMANWVERRAIQDRNLESGAPQIWSAVRSALDDACRSYNAHYIHDFNRPEVRFNPENGSRAIIVRTLYTDRGIATDERTEEILVTFDSTIPAIVATRKDKSERFDIASDQNSAFVARGDKRLDADEISRAILEPLFFRKGEKRRPIFIDS